tara:strand:+ start:346 stop:771 length:426 start_codon:yes stop_codon:yes gene_type:complete
MNFNEQYNEFCLNYFRCIKKNALLLSLTQSQALCIQAIPYDGITQTSLAIKLSLDISTLSRNLEKLKKHKIIEKTIPNYDKRTLIISLTTKGKNIYQKLNKALNESLNKVIKNIKIEDLDYMNEILNKINWEFELYLKHNE